MACATCGGGAVREPVSYRGGATIATRGERVRLLFVGQRAGVLNYTLPTGHSYQFGNNARYHSQRMPREHAEKLIELYPGKFEIED